MKKTAFFPLLAILFMICPQLSAQVPTLVIWHADGTFTDVELSTLPRVTFVNDNIRIHSDMLQMEMESKDVLRFSYKGLDTSSVENLRQETGYTWTDSRLILHGVGLHHNVTLCRADGVKVPVSMERSGSDIAVRLEFLPAGIYLIRLNGMTVKFTRQ